MSENTTAGDELDRWTFKLPQMEDCIKAILAKCSNRPHSKDGEFACHLIREIEEIAIKARDDMNRRYIGPARAHIEATPDNDIAPGEPYPWKGN